ncbi:MAG TPA: class I SAM-dependent methyltransferase [Ktedonobacteraceae bacterium]|jgi:ubiquinone/menaquinone biosynthesis C-methylase UbiE
MSDYDSIAPFYDIEHAEFDEDLDMYRNFAELCGGKILELACGSGRLLLPLAREGYTLTGVDTSAAMLEIAQRALEKEGIAARCQLVQQDMCSLQLQEKYRLAMIALGSFGHIITRAQQQQALAAIRRHLSMGATFVLDISNEDARYMEALSGQILHQGTWQQQDGSYVTHFLSPASSNSQHLLDLTHFYEVHRQGGNVQRSVSQTSLYLFERNETELLLDQAGFRVKDVYGSYEFGPYEHNSARLIFIAEAR